jgi:phospholipase/carboxylesterase
MPLNESLRRQASNGRLLSRPGEPGRAGAYGIQQLSLQAHRDGQIYVPHQYNPESSTPFVVMLHGAGGDAEQSIRFLKGEADRSGFILLAPESRAETWDIILGRYGPDVVFINQALGQVFSAYRIDPRHLAIAGFSDGASYALSLGITNGDLFSHILAFSPGFRAPVAQTGSPRIFISHGTHDTVLPIDRCSRSIVRQLRRAEFEVDYREFDGPHTVPENIAQEAVKGFLRGPAD